MEDQEWVDESGAFAISTDRERLDVPPIHSFLRETYWSPGIPIDVVRRAIEHSIAFGIYERSHKQQVGFARVTTDQATFAYLSDVFVIPEFRSRGLAKWLVSIIVAHPRLRDLRRWVLATRDAHDLYAKFGFTPLAAPDRFMELHDRGVYARLNTQRDAT
jgi:N-acetylglutamate synthase-like GNAT family acetyltransferase